MTNYRHLLLLLLLCGWRPWVEARKKNAKLLFDSSNELKFTAPVYNLTIEENARGKEVYAVSNSPIKIGVFLREHFFNVKFRIVEGEKTQFKAEARVVGNFAFLRLKYRQEGILNRELKDKFTFLIKATCKRKDAPNLETTATVNLFVTDQNDARPIFEKELYSVEVLENIKLFSNIVQVEASDADIDYNGQVYYSIISGPPEFTVDAASGWIRNIKSLFPGTYKLSLLAEDRASRLYRKKGPNEKAMHQLDNGLNKATVVIKVLRTETSLPHLTIEKRRIFSSLFNTSQLVASIRAETLEGEELHIELLNSQYTPCFQLGGSSRTNIWLLETVAGHLPQKGWKASLLAKINDEPLRNATYIIEAEIDDTRSLKFPDAVFRFSVNESSPLGFVVGRIHVTIKNGFKTDYQNLRYLIISENSTVPFWLSEDSGYIHVADWLDYSSTSFYKFKLLAKLKGFDAEATATVEITVKDSNDHSPLFAARWARGEPVAIAENFPLNKTIVKVEALDSDSNENGRVQYMLTNREDAPFSIDINSGEIKLLRRLPQNVSSWQIRVRAFDNGWPYSRSSQMVLTLYRNGTKPPAKFWPSISRDPVNRNSPVFLKFDDNISIKEDADVGKIVTVVNATDGDNSYAGLVRFGCWDDYFAVHPFTGAVFVLKNLHSLFSNNANEKSKLTYNLQVTAYDMGKPPKSTNATLKITIEDCNNHAPHFEKSFYQIHLKEDTPIGTELIAVNAIDEDFGDNGKIAYRLTGNSDQIALDANRGVLKVRQKFDREIAEQLCFTVVAYDHAQPPKLGFANVTIIIEDINDNAPQCLSNVQRVQIPEDYPDGALVTCIAAIDRDSGENGRMNFEIYLSRNANVPFRIQSDTGCVFLDTEKPLDYETTAFYNLTIKVSDNGQPTLSSFCNLIVQLIDVNENLYPPLFSDFVYEFSVFENMKPGTVVDSVKAVDIENVNSQIKYSIVDGDGIGYFSIDQKGTIRTSVILDHEIENRYWIAIKAEDDAAVPLSSIAHVLVRVLDRNDHFPMPSKPIYFVSVPENSPEMVVVKVEAEDKDDLAKEGNAGLVYSIVEGDPQSFFFIDSHTGYMTTHSTRLLDREKQKEHTVIVQICDKDISPLCTRVPVVVNVEDRNDNPPLFSSQNYKFEVQPGTIGVLCRVFAADLDEGENARLTYHLSGDSRFKIDSDGHITATEGLKEDQTVSLDVKATELVAPYGTSSARITLVAVGKQNLKKKNRKPTLINVNQWKKLSVSDADNIGDNIGRIEAVDSDGDKLWWILIGGNTNNTFCLRNDTGAIILAKPLDYLGLEVNNFTLKFAVSDGSESVFDEVTVEVSRYSAKRPQFSALHYKTQISEKTAVGTLIYVVKATVPENDLQNSVSNKVITYSIKSVESTAAADKLSIDPTSGNVFLTTSVDREVPREFSVILSARSGVLSNYAMLAISLTTEDNTAPKFLQKEYFVRVSARIPIHTVVTTVRAYDVDFGRNGVVAYSIIAGNEAGYFAIDAMSGEIITVNNLPSTELTEIVITIRATDQSDLKLSDTCTVCIQSVFDEVWLPAFQKSAYNISISKNTIVGTLLTTVGTESAVVGLRYRLQDSCTHFSIHHVSGAIYLERRLSIERDGETIRCKVFAKSALGYEASSDLTVKVIDVNEYAPYFNQSVYTGFIEEKKPAGSVVFSENGFYLMVRAYDRDSGLNGLVNYRIVSPSEPYFTVDFITGVIRTKKILDFEKIKKWSFYVQASDMGSRALTASVLALVTVFIGDVNDETPKFEQREFIADLILPTVKGVEITRLIAHDPDTVGRLSFLIDSRDVSHLFAVDSESGIVTVAANDSSLFTMGKYEIRVVVTDNIHVDSSLLRVIVKNGSQNSFGLHFLQEKYKVFITENETSATTQQLATLTALGSEPGEVITYRILNPHAEFSIGMGSGQILWLGGALDREVTPQINLLVEARSRNVKAEKAHAVVVINVEDVNDCEPRFINLPYTTVVSKDVKTGYKIMSVKAIDMDQGENGAVRYSLVEDVRYIKLNKFDGRITVAESLLETKIDVLEFTVKASDQGSPNHSSFASVSIKLVESTTPIFSHQTYRAKVSEGASNGTHILTVKAVGHPGQQFGYLIDDGDLKKQLDLDFKTGFLRVRRSLNREKIASYNLSVIALDVSKSNVFARSYIALEVEDVNDNPPRFSKSVYRARVAAVDPDVSTTAITYSIVGKDSYVFLINSLTGQIFVEINLDYELRREYSFIVTASDDDGLSTNAMVVVVVEDVNDNPPVAVPPKNVIVSSDAKKDCFITKLEASDPDTIASLPNNQPFQFSLIDGDETLVSVNPSNGVVTLARVLTSDDFEIGQKILNFSISDGVYSAYTGLVVGFVENVNQKPALRFEKLFYEISVRENGKIGTFLTTVNVIGGVKPITFALARNDFGYPWPVEINERTGVVTTRLIYDYEEKSFYQVPIMAIDNARRRTFAFLLLHIADENDNVPSFVNPKYEISISKAMREGDTLLLAYAVDDDADDQVEYDLVVPNKVSRYVKVDPKRGLLTVQKPFSDFEENLVFFVRATDLANPPHRSEAKVVLSPLPLNASLPRFSSSQYAFNISENAPLKTTVGRVQTSDALYKKSLSSTLAAPKLEYSLANEQQNPEFPFSIDSKTGEIITLTGLNSEKNSVWRFMVRVVTGEETGMFGSLALVTVFVNKSRKKNELVDVKANLTITVAEDAPIGTLIDVFSPIAFHLSNDVNIFLLEQSNSSNLFKIDSRTGVLSTTGYLDRELQEKHQLIVSSSDGKRISSRTAVNILVSDINDSPPAFDREVYQFSASVENEFQRSVLGKVNVLDADLPESNQMSFFIISGNEEKRFQIDTAGVIYLLPTFIPVSVASINLTIMAFDGKFYSSVLVTVSFLPKSKVFHCDDQNYILKLLENTSVGTVVLEGFKQVPKDFRFELLKGDSKLLKTDLNGEIVLAGSLDREYCDEYLFTFRAQTSNTVCIREVQLIIEDVNDELPIFEKSEYQITVKENRYAAEDNRYFLTKLLAVDLDLGMGGTVYYYIDESATSAILDTFDLDKNTGVLSLLKSLDREIQETYSFQVRAVDGGGHYTTAKVVVNVADENDNEPHFEYNSYKFSLLESETIGYKIGQVQAFDEDRNDKVKYEIEGSTGATDFLTIDQSTGILKLIATVDYEKMKELSFSVIAIDSGNPPLKSSCAVEIRVLDINDNAPKFGQNIYKTAIRENSAIGTKVIKVMASDADSDSFGHVTYRLSGGDGCFVMTEDGWIVVSSSLDREKHSAYRLLVSAFDAGSPPLTSSTEVIISLEDVNDNPPIIDPCNLTVVAQENVDPGYVLSKIAVSDDDTALNGGPFRLHIIGEGSESFSFDTDFNLVTNNRLSFSKKRLYLLNVVAYDRGGLSTECPLTIHVRQESLHPPKVLPLKISLNMFMNEYLGGKIGVVSAKDEDSSDLLRFFLNSDAPAYFRINPGTGEIFAAAGLKNGNYEFTVNVTDGKYVIQAPVTVNAFSITQSALDHAVSLRFSNVSAEKFLSDYLPAFEKAFAYLGKFKVLSIQEDYLTNDRGYNAIRQHYNSIRFRRNHSRRRETVRSQTTLDVLIVVSNSNGYHRPERIIKVFNNILEDMAITDDIKVNITIEVCNSNTCMEGECIGRLYLEEFEFPYFMFNNEAFSAPRHERTFECICREGFGGNRCMVPINRCSEDPCKVTGSGISAMMCVPNEAVSGFECVCPPGKNGIFCETPSCGKDFTECSKHAELSVNGHSFFQILVTASLEDTLRLVFNFRTISTDAVVMYGAGETNFHAIEIQRGYIQYRWDCGVGAGIVNASTTRVSDGKWHAIEVYRHGRFARIEVDKKHSFEGFSPVGGEVLNLRQDAMRLTFGGQVGFPPVDHKTKSYLQPIISRGMVGCFGLITIDSDELPKTKQGLRLYNTQMGCTTLTGNPCLRNPCKNGGSCQLENNHKFSCLCLTTFTGQYCEYLSPCLGNPCENRGRCISQGKSYFCECLPGYTGQNCQIIASWPLCNGNICGPFGRCVSRLDGYSYCNCSHGYGGRYCDEPPTRIFSDSIPLKGGWVSVVIAVGVFMVALLLLFILCIYLYRCCTRSNKRRQIKPPLTKDMEHVPTNFNPRVSQGFDSLLNTSAPFLPPRTRPLFADSNQLSNFQQQTAQKPTKMVYPLREHYGSSSVTGSRSPSLAGSTHCKSRRVSTPNSQNRDFSRNCLSSADELEQPSRIALRNCGKTIGEDDLEVHSSPSSQTRSVRNGRQRHKRPRFKNKNSNGVHDVVLLRDDRIPEESSQDWHASTGYGRNGDCRSVAERYIGQARFDDPEISSNCIAVGETVLAPREDDDDKYMTMHPVNRRLSQESVASQRRPLLDSSKSESESEDVGETRYVYPDEISSSQNRKPVPPAHGAKYRNQAVESANRVYDNPTGEHPLIKFRAKVNSTCSITRPLSSPDLTGDFGHIDSENELRTEVAVKKK